MVHLNRALAFGRSAHAVRNRTVAKARFT